MAEDTPAEIDFGPMKSFGRGPKAIQAAMAFSRKRRLARQVAAIQLDPDVAEVFKGSEAVNKALRAIIHAMPAVDFKKRRKSVTSSQRVVDWKTGKLAN
jgi:hypothetical protein